MDFMFDNIFSLFIYFLVSFIFFLFCFVNKLNYKLTQYTESHRVSCSMQLYAVHPKWTQKAINNTMQSIKVEQKLEREENKKKCFSTKTEMKWKKIYKLLKS